MNRRDFLKVAAGAASVVAAPALTSTFRDDVAITSTVTGRVPPTDPEEGQLAFNLSSKKVMVRRGGKWVEDEGRD